MKNEEEDVDEQYEIEEEDVDEQKTTKPKRTTKLNNTTLFKKCNHQYQSLLKYPFNTK